MRKKERKSEQKQVNKKNTEIPNGRELLDAIRIEKNKEESPSTMEL